MNIWECPFLTPDTLRSPKSMRNWFPSKKQWSNWTLPSKLTAIGTFVGVLSLTGFLIDKSFQLIPSSEDNGFIEFRELLRLYGDAEPMHDWWTGSTPEDHILWQTEGKYGDVPEHLTYWGSFCRQGSLVLSHNEEPLYIYLGQKTEPGVWDIWTVGPNAGVTIVNIQSKYAPDLPVDISAVLDDLEIEYTVFKGLAIRETAGNFIWYEVSHEGQTYWLGESWSIGSAGGNQSIWLTHDKEIANEIWQQEGDVARIHIQMNDHNTNEDNP